MSRYKSFALFLILVIVWALFFATIKYFLWGDLATTIQPDLQQIAGYLSLGWVGAFLVGGAFAQTFLKKYYIFFVSLFSLLFVGYGYIFSFTSETLFAFVIVFIGFLYGLWNVMKSVIVSIEIKKTWLPETAVTAIVGMVFVICIIIGSLLGSIIYEKIGHEGYLFLLWLLIVSSGTALFTWYDHVTFASLVKDGWGSYFFARKEALSEAMRAYIPDMKYIIAHYAQIIVVSSILWSISTIISQATVEYSTGAFNLKNSEATTILLYSALWAIGGSFLSIRMNRARWKYFLIFSLFFALVTFLIPIIGTSFTNMSILAVLLGTCFGTSVNLSDSYLLKQFWEENKKEYGASTMGLIFSSILFVSMFLSSIALKSFGYHVVMYIFSGIIVVVSVGLYYLQSKKNM